MGQSLFFRLFGLGRMPEPARSQVLAEKPLVFVEGVRGWLRPRGRLPYGIISGGVRSMHGGFAITGDRIVVAATKHVVVDLRFADATDFGSAEVEVTEAGLRLKVDMGVAVRGGEGTLELTYAHALGREELDRLPQRRVFFAMNENVAARLFLAFKWAPGTPWK